MSAAAYPLDTLQLVNAAHPYAGTLPLAALAPVGRGVFLWQGAARALGALLGAVGAGGRIVPVSGWRSDAEQRAIWHSSLAENGPGFTRLYVARPGCSEHQTGLAIDLALDDGDIDFIRPAFPYDGVCGAFRARAAEFGFVLRYPAGKEAVTGIAHEPWHFRFVGAPHAARMAAAGLCLEEYLQGGRP